MKKSVLVFFGGVGVEHDISVITGLQTINSVNSDVKSFNAELIGTQFIPVYISKGGSWYVGDKLLDASIYSNFKPLQKGLSKATLAIGENMLYIFKRGKYRPFIHIDNAILCNHGKGGEDGALQGILESCNIPYTSSNMISSAICMDKIHFKGLLRGNGFKQTESVWFTRKDWEKEKVVILKKLEILKYPLVVKPSALGSSIGISICPDLTSLINAICVACKFEHRIIVEEAVENLREFNCSVLGYGNEFLISDIEEPVSWEKFLSFNSKYLSGGSGSGMGSSKRIFPANIEKEITDEIKHLSEEVFKLCDCKGVIRVDFLFNSETKELFVNEVNTIPGSLANYFWKKEKISYQKLIILMLEASNRAFAEEKRSSQLFASNALNLFTGVKSGFKNSNNK